MFVSPLVTAIIGEARSAFVTAAGKVWRMQQSGAMFLGIAGKPGDMIVSAETSHYLSHLAYLAWRPIEPMSPIYSTRVSLRRGKPGVSLTLVDCPNDAKHQ